MATNSGLEMFSNVTSTQTYACRRLEVSCRGLATPSLKGHAIFNIVLSAFLTAVLGNGLVFAAYYFSESLRRPAHTVLMSLAATNFLSGMLTQPLFIVEKSLLIGACTEAICDIISRERDFMVFFTGATILNLSAITLDRYIAICHTYKYPELVTNGRVKKLLVTVWLTWLVILSVWIQFELKMSRLLSIVLVSNVLVICILYVKIMREIRGIGANPGFGGNEAEQERVRSERKSLQTLVIIFGLLSFCFVPIIIFGLYKVLTNIPDIPNAKPLLLYASNAYFSNSSLNVFVYYLRNEEIRLAMQKVVMKIRQRFQNEVHS